MIETVKTFEGFSGQNINLQKIEIMDINISTEIIEEFASIYGCKKGEWPNMYLGLGRMAEYVLRTTSKILSFFLEDYY